MDGKREATMNISFPFEGMIDVYGFYDKPLLFSLRNEGQLYLAVAIDENDECETWLYTPCTEDQIKEAVAADSYRSLFANPDGGKVIEAKTFFGKHPMTFTERLASTLTDDELPGDAS